jgi:hypothetical protein
LTAPDFSLDFSLHDWIYAMLSFVLC